MSIRSSLKLKVVSTLVLLALILSSGMVIAIDRAFAQVEPPDKSSQPDVEVVNPYFTIEKIQTDDGIILERGTINAPPEPLPEFEAERLASIQPLPSEGIIPSFPSYSWVFGCSAVSGAMIAAHYDNNGYTNIYAGPTNGGNMPQTDTSWSTWSDGYKTYPNNPLIASHNGVDGRATKGSIDDYWVKYGSVLNDPYITGVWTQHTWSDAIGDYMKTSQSAYDNTDGKSSFYNWKDTALDPSAQLTCTQMEGYSIDHLDGTYGRKLFYEARGYSVGDCYNQNTDNKFTGGFSLIDFQAEIDADHPVLLNLEGHSIVGYGYSGSTVYIRDTWDNDPSNTYTMTWGGSYEGMELYSVSVVHLGAVAAPSAPTGISASDGTFTNKVTITWNASSGATYYKVFRNSTNTTIGATELVSSHPSSPYDDFSVSPGSTYFYWVKACNSAGCSGYSSSDSGYAISGTTIPPAPTGVSASDGTFTNKVHITWNSASGATYYDIYRNTSNSHVSELLLVGGLPVSPHDDFSVIQDVPYYYWVKACNSIGCSGYSSVDSGYAASEVTVNMIYLPLIMKQEFIPPQTIINGDFEQGHVGWMEYSSAGYDLIYGGNDWAQSGSWIAYLGGYHNAVDQLYQEVTITASQPYLNFYGIINSDDACGYDYFYLGFGEDSWFVDLCSDNNTPDWVHFYANFSEYIGSTETLYFIVETDGSLYSDFFIDTVFMSASATSASDSTCIIEGAPVGFELQPLQEGKGFKIKDIDR